MNEPMTSEALEEAESYFKQLFGVAAHLLIGRKSAADPEWRNASAVARKIRLTKQLLHATLSGSAEWTLNKFARICLLAGEHPVDVLEAARRHLAAEEDHRQREKVRQMLVERSADLVLEVARDLPESARRRILNEISVGKSKSKEA